MYNKKNSYIEALIIYNYLREYIEFENIVKKEFISNFTALNEEYKNRVYFYLGGVGSMNTYIDYDTYSLVKETNRYDNSKLLNRLTMNQIIKLERKEKAIESFNKSVKSIQRPMMEFSFYDCCIKLINTRNKMAHEFCNLDIKDKDSIEILSKAKIEQMKPEWLSDFEYNELENSMQAILSNYIYMKEMKKILINS